MADDIEIPVGVYVGRVIRRWWIVLACALIAAAIALIAGRSDGKQVWSAKTLVSLGAPFSFNGGAITSSSGTNPNYVPAVIRQEAVIAAAAQTAGLQPSQLRGHISSQPTGQPSKLGYTPLVTITVQGPWSKAAAQAAADAVATQVLERTNAFQTAKAKTLETQQTRLTTQLGGVDSRITNTQAAIARLVARGDAAAGISLLALQSQLNGQIAQQNVVQNDLADAELQLTQVQYAEMGRIESAARAVRASTGGTSSNVGVALILGALVGVFLALLSYAVSPGSRRNAPDER